jgi:hypothetical protein
MPPSKFLSNLHYFYAQTDGTYAFPSSAEGDLLKQAKKEVEELREWMEHIARECGDEEDAGAYVRDMIGRALRAHSTPGTT